MGATTARHYRAQCADKVLSTVLKKLYGLTLEDYQKMLAAQGGVCAICKQPPAGTSRVNRRLSVDHCAQSTLVRGLLCQSCNNGLGRFMHEPALLERAAAYLRQPPAFGVV